MFTKSWLRRWNRAGGSRRPLGRVEPLEDRVVPATYTQNFDVVAAPALPAGWTTVTLSGTANPWDTITAASNSAPNAAHAASTNSVSDSALVSPVFNILGPAQVGFRHAFRLEANYDGGVLEVSVNGGAFADITADGGGFTMGGYNGSLIVNTGNPLLPGTNQSRSVYTGTSTAFTPVTANIPAAAVGGTVQLRWRVGHDNQNAESVGWRVDDVIVTNATTSFTYAAPAASPVSSYALRRSGANFQIVDSNNPGTVLASQAVDVTDSISFVGRPGANDTFVLDTSGGDLTTPVRYTGQAGSTDALLVLGAGTAVLGGTSSYPGTTTVAPGATLLVGAVGGGTGNIGTGAVINNGTLVFNRIGDVTLANTLTGSGALIQNGPGRLYLAGLNGTAGPTFVNARLIVGSPDGGTAGGLGSGPVTVSAAGALGFARTDAITVPNPIGGAGSVFTLPGADVTLTGGNTYTGETEVSLGVLRVGEGGTSGAVGTGRVHGYASGGILVYNRADDFAVPNVISGGAAVTQAGPNNVTLAAGGTYSYSGATTVSNGVLLLDGTLPNTSGVVVNGVGALGGGGSTSRPVAVGGGGSVLPGNAAAIATLSTGSVTFAGAGTTFGVKFGGPGAADVLNVTGAVDLGGTTLFILPLATLPVGTSVTILQNDGADAVGGTFAGVGEGGVALDGTGGAYRVSYVGGDGNDITLTVVTPPPPPGGGLVGPLLVTGPGTGGGQLFGANGGQYGAGTAVTLVPGFAGELRGALGDVTGDGVPDGVVGTGPGAGRVVVVDGANGPAPNTGNVLADFVPFPGYAGGLFVAVGDLTGDGIADVVVTPDAADAFSGPVSNQLPVRVYNGASLRGGTGSPALVAAFDGLASLNGLSGQGNPAVKLGGRPAVADVNGDGRNDLLVAAGSGGGPRVTVWNGTGFAGANGGQPTTNPIANLFVFESTQRGGAFVAAGDVNGDGRAEIVVGGGPGGGPRLRVVNSGVLLGLPNLEGVNLDDPTNLGNGLVLNNFFAGSGSNRGGVRVAAKDVDGDGRADVVAGSGTGEASAVRVYRATQLATVSGSSSEPGGAQTFDPFAAVLPGGVWVG